MEVKHLILETNSAAELQALLDSNAKSGFRAISFSTYYDGNYGTTYYTALMEKAGSSAADSK